MHLEQVRFQDSAGQVFQFSWSTPPESIQRCIWFDSERESSVIIGLLALACTGGRHVEALARRLPGWARPAGPARLEFVLVRDLDQECVPHMNPRLQSGWEIEPHNVAIRPLIRPDMGSLDSALTVRKPPSGSGNKGGLLLGYGPDLPQQPWSDTFDFADPHH